MGIEIERKFLVVGDTWRAGAIGKHYCQGYIRSQGTATVRVRTVEQTGYLTLKGPTRGVSRLEFEYEIPFEDADQILRTLCDRPLIEKVRYLITHDGLQWEVDEFLGDNQGLIMAEIELTDP
ncbi:MAG: CYTH domain-containing protein, partial [Symploca sp. SIO3C6]|nr:CYTH domain-containing protein [Symploca sp. SIO3C6]